MATKDQDVLSDEELLRILEGSEDSDPSSADEDGPWEQDSESSSDNDSDTEDDPNLPQPPQAQIPDDHADNADNWNEVDCSTLQNIVFTGMEIHNYSLNYPENHLDLKPIHVFRSFIDDEVVELVVCETNRNAKTFLEKTLLSHSARAKAWKETTNEEVLKFFGIVLYMGLVPYPYIPDYWSSNPLYKDNPVSKTMSRNRFQLLLRFIHFENNETADKTDRIYKVRKLLDMLQAKFCAEYKPGETVAVDESMVPFRGRLFFRQYIPNKTHRYGVKIFKLCNQQGYTLKMIVYTGKLFNVGQNLGEQVVLQLLGDYLNEGHTVVTDNYYTSVPLARELIKQKTHLIGTLRKNRKYLPHSVVKSKLNKGDVVGKECNGIVVAKWQDKRDVMYLSTKHGIDMELTGRINRKTRQEITKPAAILEYNKGKQGIDVSDQMASYFSPLRKTIRWYHKVAFEFMFNTSIVNASFLYNKLSHKRMNIKNFRENVIMSLLELDPPCRNRPSSESSRTKRTNHHLIENPKRDRSNRKIRQRCSSCYQKASNGQGREFAQKNVKKISTLCEECKKFYCLTCFQESH
ncbi:piggyBac transposable element-derived protein 4-like [Nilaparvata lugens]|nr:piggyBac transposable element-derived protein 4-like [Nilaparvata lugens]XP_039282419.1 piggyBac transposable element-derived protein 4-like isoform X2 [Nilaparvata lugens]XP_039287092.1 piggyBac transposable element-derived protein 4-like [Nilaparvata lugens]